ncbi:hypothetical protein JMJ35_007951 [Cladonia borealis]|uniref:Glycogen debranching enzyme n=1 Tax=Cladonia borealis TaxID=184061 RepID=A0AA39QUM1_9LECA|nr:hypothetical protein JMJ35_007951 [Cladonia borealis]
MSESEPPLYLHVSDPPYENYFYADATVSCQAVLASPLIRTDSDAPAQHRLLFAWPAGNSGAALFFTSSDSKDDAPVLKFKVGPRGRVLDSVKYEPDENSRSGLPSVGVSGLLEVSSSAVLRANLAILGSIRTIRDYTEGHGTLNHHVQTSIAIAELDETEKGVSISRVWFDGKTTTRLTIAPASGAGKARITNINSDIIAEFSPGLYSFQALLDYPQTPYMPPTRLLKPSYHYLIQEQPDAVRSLSFLCTSEKILAGAWRYLTYFGRDSMISLLLLNPILDEGELGIIEAGLSAVLERVNGEDGSVCHEENLGDYPAACAALNPNKTPEAQYDYKMVDTDFFLPIVLNQYLMESEVAQRRIGDFLRTQATLIPSNRGKTYSQLLSRTCRKILDMAEPFTRPGGNAMYKNLIALKEGVPVGQWRDSNDGLGGGRYPYDVNTALMPAALRAISNLARTTPVEKDDDWGEIADKRAEVWETLTLDFFNCKIPQNEARSRLDKYRGSGAFPGPSGADQIHEDLLLQAIALKEDGTPVEIMHTDACFRLLLLPHLIHSSNPACITQHLQTIDALCNSILLTFPAGLSTPVGILIANPAFSLDSSHWQKFTTGAYHGTVVWTWNSLAMIAKGLEVHLSTAYRAEKAGYDAVTVKSADPDVYNKVTSKMKRAYGKLWDTIEANKAHLSHEVWSWRWDEKEGFVYVPLSHLPTPDGAGQTESNARQLWSLPALLALERRRWLEE